VLILPPDPVGGRVTRSMHVVMPGIDGIELARHMAARQPGIRVMFITGFAAVAVADERLAAHRPRILAKLFHLRHLIAEIDALLSPRPAQ
jgi:two-component system, cell cycle response regulator CpdR